MKGITGEARALAAFYLVFALFLCGLGSEPARPTVEATAPTLHPTEEETENPLAAMAAALHRLGFVYAPREGPSWPRPIPYTVTAWQARAPVLRPVELLVRAGQEVVSSLTGAGMRLLRTQWGRSGARLRLDLEMVLPGEGGVFVSLEATGKEEKTLLRKRPAARPPVPLPRLRPRPPSPPKPPVRPRLPRVAIVLDDVGEVTGLEEFLALPIPLTIAVMPKRRYSEDHARMARAAGREVLLHLPLEARNGQDPGPGVIRTGWPPERIREELEEDLASVPGAVGVNNHMGSLGTADEALMRTVLGILKEKSLFFLDSRTSAASVVPRVAGEIGLQYAVNEKFLDPEGASIECIQELMRELIQLAKKRGRAVGICHANRPHTLAALRAMVAEFAAAGVEVVPLGEIVGE